MTWEKCFNTRDRRSSSCEGRACRCACGVPLLLIGGRFANCGGEVVTIVDSFAETEAGIFVEPSSFGVANGEGFLLSEYGRVCLRSRHCKHTEGLTSWLDLILSADIRGANGTGAMKDSTTGRDTCRSRGLIACYRWSLRLSSHYPTKVRCRYGPDLP